MPLKQKVVVSFAEKVGIVDVSYMPETAQRLDAQRALIFFQKKPHDNVIRLSREGNVELIESPDPRQEIKTINGYPGSMFVSGFERCRSLIFL